MFRLAVPWKLLGFRLLFGVLVGVVAAIGAWRLLPADKPALREAEPILAVTATTPALRVYTESLDVTGVTIERDEVQILTELNDVRVKEIFSDVGDAVLAGQPLAVLDGESLVNKKDVLAADYERAADAYRRVDALRKADAVSQQMVIEARTAMQNAKAQLADAKLSLKRSIITAPVAGTVTERKAILGALVSTDVPLFRIAKDGVIEVEAEVPEADLRRIAIGGKASVLLSDERVWREGYIRLGAQRIDPATRTAKIRVALKQATNLPVGLFSSIRIETWTRTGLAIPATALQTEDGRPFVWNVNADRKIERIWVSVVGRTDKDVVLANIPVNSRVVARAGVFVKQGDTVRVSK
jgi:HlyD family secretion protein